MAPQDTSKFKKFTFSDVLIIIFVLCISVLLFSVALDGNNPYRCVIEIDGAEYAVYNMAELGEEKIIEIDNEFGKNTIVLDRYGAKITHSDCPDASEVKSGKITESGQSLICLPHRLIVKLEGGGKNDGNSW